MLPYASSNKQIEADAEPYDYEQAKEVRWVDHLLLNRPLKLVLAAAIFAVMTPLLIYHFLFFSSIEFPPTDGHSLGSCILPRSARLLCGVGFMNDTDCHSQCCYDYNNGLCFHRFPSRFSYIIPDIDWSEEIELQPRISTVPYKSQNSLNRIRLSIDEISTTHLSLNFYDSTNISLEGKRLEEHENKSYEYHVSGQELTVLVNGTKGVIFNTLRGPLIASEDIWEISFKLTEELMFGLGEIPLKEDTAKVIYGHGNGLSSIPLIFAKSNDSYHGLLIDIVEPTEVKIQGENQILVRSITRRGMKFHLFVGPEPKDITRDVMAFLGAKPKLEYWMLGVHICNDNDRHPSDAYNDLTQFLGNATSSSLPFESHCGVQSVVFEECEDNEYISKGGALLKTFEKRFVPHISPYIKIKQRNSSNDTSEEVSRQSANCSVHIDLNHFMLRQSQSEDIYIGKVGSNDTVYPDYENITEELFSILLSIDTNIDGVILQNNWPLDESLKSFIEAYDGLPYFSKNFELAFNNTPQWNVERPNGDRHIYDHNKYGNNFANSIKSLGLNIPIWSSNQWMNGEIIINRQNINASWTNLQKELNEAALGGISGHRLWSTPVCGDTEFFDPETQANLCLKWYQAATYIPLLKIHSKNVSRDPFSFVGTNQNYMLSALKKRTSLSPYFYTTLQKGPLLRPMFYQFPRSEGMEDVTAQFAVGDDLLIVPNLHPSQNNVHLKMPPGIWYEFESGLPINAAEGEMVSMTTTEADLLTLIRGSAIIAVQEDIKESIAASKLSSAFTIIVALNCETYNITNELTLETVTQTDCNANGELYFDDDLSLNFTANNETLTVTAQGNIFETLCDETLAEWARTIQKINIFGLEDKLNNYDYHRQVTTAIDLCQLETSNQIEYNFTN